MTSVGVIHTSVPQRMFKLEEPIWVKLCIPVILLT